MNGSRKISKVALGGFSFAVLTGCTTTDQQLATTFITSLASAAATYDRSPSSYSPPSSYGGSYSSTPSYSPPSSGYYSGGGGCGSGYNCSGCGIK